MWPFKKEQPKTEEPDLKKEMVEELKKFRARGDKFRYQGVEMLVYAHSDCYCQPSLRTTYVNKLGDIKFLNFDYDELDILKKENL